MNKLVTYLAIAVTLVAVDMVWLLLVAKGLYQEGIGHLMAAKPNLVAAGIFYLLYPLGIWFFAVQPAGDDGVLKAAMLGAALGLFAYATYDLTNMATLKDWPLGLSLLDIAWGGFVTALAASAGKAASDWMG